ncbi:MAG: hypothetical protein LC768_01975, partial [Acidobacteria bacterium]|nr:hypothetical protein [Acidobacteriota bacterium]
MKKITKAKKICVYLCLSVVSFFVLISPLLAQTKPLIKRTTYKTETIEFSAGGTVSVVGAPNGSITIEGWQKNEVEISVDIEVQAENESDLNQLAQVSDFVLDEGFGHVRIKSVGTHDKSYMKRVTKKFPKNLLTMPFRIDYRIKVPAFCNIEIDGGRGDLVLSNIEGAMRINFLESNATINLVGGVINAVVGKGNVDVVIPSKNRRGRAADVQLASGTLTAQMPQNISADINAKILREGKIENSFDALKPRERTKFTEQSIVAKAGNGGTTLN